VFVARATLPSTPIEIDADLAARCAAGDRVAQRELFEREIDRVHATLYRLLGPCRDLEDLTQEAFLEIFRSLATFRGEARLATWLSRITAHVAYRYLSTRKPPTAWLEAVEEPASPVASAERSMLARDAVRRLYEILTELDPVVRLAFALHVLEGHTLEQVSDFMQSSLVATKSRVWRARRRLRRDPAVMALLNRDGSEEEPR
jgi:RNA polymerase sigma-70 factor (ECF subfamily)